MEGQVQDLTDLVSRLQAENERLRQQQAAASGPGAAPATLAGPSTNPPVVERLLYVPRDRKCPMFRGRTGIGLTEWLEEVQACMRTRHLSVADQAFFLFDHLEGEARDEIKYRPGSDREDPARVIAVLQELYGCTDSYVALQEAFFSRRQQEGETLHEYSLALMSLMASVKGAAPSGVPNAEILLRDQFVEQVFDCALRRELKQFVRRQPTATLLEVRGEAMQWEREGLPGGVRSRSYSVPSVPGFQCGVGGSSQSVPPVSELSEIKEMLRLQQEQILQMSQDLLRLQNPSQASRPPRRGPIICRRCQQPGHFAQDCDGVRVAPSARPVSPTQRSRQRNNNTPSPSEN
ncbi:uncharacterized protein LOC110015877 [Oryzias latipes]|uniref:uncharacterized protein LOC110015877 n=1 Tax=Oryzias latipes TaxID=8090 RepID=UPI000CE28E26|nr:uncharacterized protein LOC110015877 [Oryzias latipes]XP_023815432.1 uncharacterized protein LOC110015877 [Oryzias latipes]XP_023815433.1 uncharacterized protein LOC110015877 [Oryzias latipes]XP_023815434.1 uncharacterized protein LOC110015877 [Oryzias latipes]XP_023815435.1 uncharacterized protein LOC110015877 [Oryzias latipes]XP_023815436.1 uncharacterized protein LOC110015877 [Oryzias latipes]XP_023815437.1 uncharacterized protein LOC110015877 [Oryzias latipes]